LFNGALAANDGSASQRAVEQWANLSAHHAQNPVREAAKARDALERRARRDGTVSAEERAAMQAAERAVREAALAARAPLRQALATIERLIALHPTMERESLAGSACKRMAIVEAEAGSAAEALAAVQQMKLHYARAEAIAGVTDLSERYYPALNRMAAELVADAGRPGWQGFDDSTVAATRQALVANIRDDPEFWSLLGLAELDLYESLASKSLAMNLSSIGAQLSALHARVSGRHYWTSALESMQFVLRPYMSRAPTTEHRAARELEILVAGFATPDDQVSLDINVVGRFDVFISHQQEDEEIAAALSSGLVERGFSAQTSADVNNSALPSAALDDVLTKARLCLVIVGKHPSATRSTATAGWSRILAAVWKSQQLWESWREATEIAERTGTPLPMAPTNELRLASLVVGSAPLPAILQDAPSIKMKAGWRTELANVERKVIAILDGAIPRGKQ
jgi:hypothetical protein